MIALSFLKPCNRPAGVFDKARSKPKPGACVRYLTVSALEILFEVLDGQTERRHRLLQEIGKHRRTDQVGCRAVVVGLRSLGVKLAPIVDVAVASAKPHQGDEVDLFIDIEAA